MTKAPATKDWTWGLGRACPGCRFDASNLDPSKVPALMAQVAAAWQEVLAGAGVEVAQRPSDDRWSTLEYACHVRDVFRLADVRFSLMLDQDGPELQNWDQDETAITDRYSEQDPHQVAADTAAAAAMADGRIDRKSTRLNYSH